MMITGYHFLRSALSSNLHFDLEKYMEDKKVG